MQRCSPYRLVGDAPAFRHALHDLASLARSSATLLLTGETGTGKELVARAIHSLSPRAAQQFVAVNCGAVPDSLLEDELFGHERGAFTDARVARAGLFAQAHLGTLLLDEIDALTPRAQVALLRVLQDRRYRPLGAGGERYADVRFIAASNGDLAERVREHLFRADLFYRLEVLTLRLPPLRERKADILPLAEHFLALHKPPEQPLARFTPAAVSRLLDYDWPGNIRELENAIIRAVARHDGELLDAADLGLDAADAGDPGLDVAGAATSIARSRAAAFDASHEQDGATSLAAQLPRAFREAKRHAVRLFERAYLVRVLAEHGGNVTRASRAAGKERREFGKLLKKHHLDRQAFVSQRIVTDLPVRE